MMKSSIFRVSKPTETNAMRRGPGKPFEKGHKLSKGGRRNPPGDRPTKAEAQFKENLKAEVERQAQEKVKAIAKKYISRATGPKGDKVLMHLIDKVMPDTKQVIDLNISSPEDFYRDIQEAKKR